MIVVLGINHETAPLSIREKLTFSDEDNVLFLKELKIVVPHLEAVLVSTCNRTELYFSVNESCTYNYSKKFILLLLNNRNLDKESESNFYVHCNYEAVHHILRVASGLDSMVIGENQILGQLKNAYRLGAENNLTGTVINRLFHKAFEAGKKVRTDTEINEGASSVGFAGVELAHKIFGELENNPVLLIGAGETGELVLQSLKSRGSRYISIINRTKSKADELSAKFGVTAKDFDSLESALIESDIVITSTSAGKVLLDKDLILRVMKKRKKKLFLLIDLSVPRNIDEEIRDINNTFLFNMDDLSQIVEYNNKKRQGAVEKAEIIIDKISDEFMTWKNSLRLSPTINALKQKLLSYSENELSDLKKKTSKEEYKCVNSYSDFITKKYLGLIIKNLKKLSKNGTNLEYIELVNNLFELEPGIKDQEKNTNIPGDIIGS